MDCAHRAAPRTSRVTVAFARAAGLRRTPRKGSLVTTRTESTDDSAGGGPAPAEAQQPSNQNDTTPPSERRYLLEQIDDAAVVQLYADGFAALPLREKTLIWHLYQAAI